MSKASAWIFSPLQDLTLILLTPLPILLAFAAAQRGGWMDGLLAFGLALAMAHYFPGILRAYGDRSLFRRFRIRLTVVPLVLVSITTAFAYFDLNFIFVITAVWGAWHWMMQIYGFARIYDSKAHPAARTHPLPDQLLCLAWFGTCVFVLNEALPIYLTQFYQSGGPRLSAHAFVWFTRGWLILTLALTIVYVIRTASAIRQGRPPNLVKLMLILVTFVYLRYTASMVDRPMVGYVMFEAWHDIQYLTIVWMFNLSRARRNPEAGAFIRFLFRPKALLAMAYVGVCLLFGSFTHAWRLFENPALARIAVASVIATALLHYYLDGFIWKIREQETRQALGVSADPDRGRLSATTPFVPIWVRAAALWLLFAGTTGYFLVAESTGNPRPRLEVYENVVEAFPDSVHARYQIGRELQDLGRLREAKVHFERVLAMKPAFFDAHKYLGVLLGDQRELEGARHHFEEALKLDAGNAEVHNNLGIITDEQGELQTAKSHLESAVSLSPDYALAHNNLGFVLTKLGEHDQAILHLENALRLDPDQHLAHNTLGEVMMSQGKFAEAKAHFEQALRINPDDPGARRNLASLNAKQ